MENRKYIIFVLVFSATLFFKPVFAYEIGTHAFLTKETIEFYSQKIGTSTIKEFSDYLIDGSRKEDDLPRPMNHFYDPVYNRGLSQDSVIDQFYILGNWPKSKDWAVNSDLQNEVKYKVPTTVASVLTAIQQGKISSLTTETDFTWNQALYYWINGEKEKAMFSLGHILHLIQDASVPDHTRNDPHPGDSPYENYTSKFTLNNQDKELSQRLINKNIITLPDLDIYFDEMAKYSNNNFYSKDTIGIKYDKPEPEFYPQKINGLYFAFKKDNISNNDSLLFFLKTYKEGSSLLTQTKSSISLKDPYNKVLSSYWSLLSPKAVQYSASVIDFFFKEAERLKDDPQFAKRESFFAQVVDVTKNIVSVIIGTVKDIVGAVKDNAQIQDQNLLISVPLDENIDTAQPSEQKIIGPSLAVPSVQNELVLPARRSLAEAGSLPKEVKPIVEGPKVVLKQNNEQEIKKNIASSTQNKLLDSSAETSSAQKQNIQTCSFQTTKTPTYQKLLINEVAWMGSVKNSSDEWIELKNISGSELDISNWQVLDKEEQIKITFPENTKISAGGFLLLERTDDNSVPNVKADIIYTGALSNSNDALRLFDDKCGLIDEVFANSEWPAGEAATKRTMERQADLTWWTYNGAGEGSGDALILGTPKKENMVKVVYYGGGGGGSAATVAAVETISDTSTQPSKLLISEVQISPVGNRFIELYNPSDSPVDLTNWSVKKKTSSGTEYSLLSSSRLEGKSIPSKSYFLLANEEGYEGNIIPDVFWARSNTISKDNTIIVYDNNQNVIDKVGFGLAADCDGACALNPNVDQKSIQRKIQNNEFIDTDNNANDFEIQNCPSPKAQSKSCAVSEASESNQAPSAFFDFSPTAPKTGETVFFNAASSTDFGGNIVLYDWNFGDGFSATSTQATTTYSYLLAENYNVSLTVFDNLNATSTISKTITVSANIVSNQAPIAVFNFLPTEPKTNEAIIFNAASSTDPDGNIALYDWNFGDNQLASSTQATTTHSYLLAGNYNISLTVFDNLNTTSTYTLPLSVASSTIQESNLDQQASSTPQTGHVLISEILFNPQGSDEGKEFIELYNPADNNFDLRDWSLRILKNNATSTDLLVKFGSKNEDITLIKSKSFLLAGFNNHTSISTPADVVRSIALPNSTSTIYLIDKNGVEIDQVNHSNILENVGMSEGQSLERKALLNNICVSAQGDGEFLGNVCDTDSAGDWEIRNIPAPQNSQNFPEPRTKPATVINFIGEYDKPNKKINLSWNESGDYSGATSTLSYLISDISPNPILNSIKTASTTAEFNISEIGRDYVFEIKAADKEGLSSDVSTITISVSGVSIEDVNYFILNQTETSGTMGLSDRIFKPLATGVIDLMAFNVGVSYNQNIPGTSSDVYIDLYEWNSATQNKGILLAKSGAITVYSHTSGLTLYFSGENSVVLDSSKYYYFEINTTSSGLSINWRPYIVIKAASTGIIGISSPASNYVYGDPNVDFSFKYLEPSSNKYNAVVVETRDFYTDVIVDNYRVDLETSQKTIGWHEISGNLGINRPGYFKIKASLSDSIKSEAYFSVFGAEPAEGKLLDQNSFSTGLSGSQFSGQVFRPVVSGQVDSLTLRVNSTGSDSSSQSDSYWNIYEWDGTGNDLNGSRGALLATTTPKFLVPRTYYPGPVEETWDFDSNNEIYLDSSKYYFLTLSIVSRNPQNPLTPQLSMNISTNGSLIDGRLIGQYINQGDLYLIINKKAENPSL